MARLCLGSLIACYAMHIACAERLQSERDQQPAEFAENFAKNLAELTASEHKDMFTHAMDCRTRQDQNADWPTRFGYFISQLRKAVVAQQKYTHPTTTRRPLMSLVKSVKSTFGENIGGIMLEEMVQHTAVELVNLTDKERVTEPGMLYPDSRCFKFSYTGSSGDDPSGCAFFRESFDAVKQARECIVNHLDNSPLWQKYEKEIRPPANETMMSKENFEGKCAWSDKHDRAEEMIKRVTKIHKGKPASDGYTLEKILEKLQLTIAIPGGKPKRGVKVDKSWPLEENTLKNIAAECFHISTSADSTDPSETATDLRLKGSCMFGMWDYVEVAGAPHTPLSKAESNLDPALGNNAAVPLEYYNSTPSLCGRVATLMVSPSIVQASYSLNPSVSYHMYDLEQCALSTKYNCIQFVDCWRHALKELTKFVPECRGEEVVVLVPPSPPPSLLRDLKDKLKGVTLAPLWWQAGRGLATVGANRGRIAASIINFLFPGSGNKKDDYGTSTES